MGKIPKTYGDFFLGTTPDSLRFLMFTSVVLYGKGAQKVRVAGIFLQEKKLNCIHSGRPQATKIEEKSKKNQRRIKEESKRN